MSYIQPYLRSQTELLADVRADNYTSALGWSDANVYRTLNRALQLWQERVAIGRVYTISGGWVSGTYDYSLPVYIRGAYVPQMYRQRPYDDDLPTTGDEAWQDLPGWQEEPNTTGGLVLRVTMRPVTVNGRVVWYAPNSPVPATVPTTNAETSSTATSLTVGAAIDIVDSGWVKIGTEWLFYAGVTPAASATTLNNLQRAQFGTTAATHATSSSVTFGVAADDLGLYDQLLNRAKQFLHQQKLVNTGVGERSEHEKLMQFYKNEADEFWLGYRSQRPSPRIVLDRQYLLR